MQEHIKRYHPLGTKTLVMMVLKRSAVFLLFLPILFVGVFFLGYVPESLLNVTANAMLIYVAFLIIAALLALALGWLEYARYWIFVDDRDVKIARGLIATEQIGIPYRRIQDVKIKRSLVDQLFGVSNVVITMLGPGENEPSAFGQEEDEIILPALDKKIALEIQDIVLKKAQVEQVHILGR